MVLDLEACERNEDLNFVFTGFHLSGKVGEHDLISLCMLKSSFKAERK